MLLAFLMVAAAMVLAQQSPATGYERSIYASTPWLVWILIGVALLTAIGAVIYWDPDFIVAIALGLGGTAMMAVNALPTIRGYHFLGAADSLTHLNWTKDIASGVIEPGTLFYPAYHSILLRLSRLLDMEFEHALLGDGRAIRSVPRIRDVDSQGDNQHARATAMAGVASR